MTVKRADIEPAIVIPRGRSAAERRLGAVAALHQPVRDKYSRVLICGECHKDSFRDIWPCATARLLGEWPGEIPE